MKMQIVIDIDEDLYKSIIGHRCKIIFQQRCDYEDLKNAIEDGIPLPKGHGRLVDVDAIPEQIELKGFLSQDNAHLVTIYRVKEALDNAPTIIKADRSEEE
jgi:hypothetical protein